MKEKLIHSWINISVIVILLGLPISGIGAIQTKNKVRNLPEFIVRSNNDNLLHVLAYVREYSTMSTYSDTIFMYREKMVDFMIPARKRKSKLGWTLPRILSSNSYYRFTDDRGLDSVSASCRHHFSWSDWIGIPDLTPMPKYLSINDCASDTVWYNSLPSEIWTKEMEKIKVDINCVSDNVRTKWLPEFASLFNETVDFYKFNISYDYDNVLHTYISPLDIKSFKFGIESKGRGRNMFRFGRRNQTVFFSTDSEVYILDLEYITSGEAKKWAKRNFDRENLPLLRSPEAPQVSLEIANLIHRVENIDTTQVRVTSPVDKRIGYRSKTNNYEFGMRMLNILKQATGISMYKSHKNAKNQWRRFQKKVREMNDTIAPEF